MKTKELATTNSPLHPERLVTVSPNLGLGEAIAIMEDHGIHHLPVVDGDRLVGMLSERDVAHLLLTRGKSGVAENLRVEHAMHSEVPSISETTEIEAALHLMLGNQLGALPVVREGKLIGILTETDILQLLEAMLKRDGRLETMVNRGEGLLANPLVQNVLKTLSDMGL